MDGFGLQRFLPSDAAKIPKPTEAGPPRRLGKSCAHKKTIPSCLYTCPSFVCPKACSWENPTIVYKFPDGKMAACLSCYVSHGGSCGLRGKLVSDLPTISGAGATTSGPSATISGPSADITLPPVALHSMTNPRVASTSTTTADQPRPFTEVASAPLSSLPATAEGPSTPSSKVLGKRPQGEAAAEEGASAGQPQKRSRLDRPAPSLPPQPSSTIRPFSDPRRCNGRLVSIWSGYLDSPSISVRQVLVLAGSLYSPAG